MCSQENKINKIIEESIKNISSIVDVNTVVGSPIRTNTDDIIIPISKVSTCILAGGGEYGKLNVFSKGDLPFSAGNGTIVSINPCGFLVKDGVDNRFRLLSVSQNSCEKILEKAQDIILNMQDDVKNDK